jgi:NCS1 family nucleobase:cation symporter-1
MMPWKLLASADAYIFNWLIGYSALLGPIAGIMIADYWFLRRKELDVPDLYRLDGRYGRVNGVAITALVVGVAPNVPGFLKSTHAIGWEAGVMAPKNFFDEIYVYAWFTGFLISGVLYLAGMRLRRGH